MQAPELIKSITRHLIGHFLLLFIQVRRFLFLTNSWLQCLYSPILSLLLPSVFIPTNPKQARKSSISTENNLGCVAMLWITSLDVLLWGKKEPYRKWRQNLLCVTSCYCFLSLLCHLKWHRFSLTFSCSKWKWMFGSSTATIWIALPTLLSSQDVRESVLVAF